MIEKPSPTFTVRPNKDLLPKLQRLAKETGKSEGQLLAESAAIIIEMIESGLNFVPPLVRATRILRENVTSFDDGRALLGGSRRGNHHPEQILASETVRGIAPDLRFLRVYEYIPTSIEESNPAVHHSEWLAVPDDKAKAAQIAFKVTPKSIDLAGPLADYSNGDILLLTQVTVEEIKSREFHKLYLYRPAIFGALYNSIATFGLAHNRSGDGAPSFKITKEWARSERCEVSPPEESNSHKEVTTIPFEDCAVLYVVNQKLELPRN